MVSMLLLESLETLYLFAILYISFSLHVFLLKWICWDYLSVVHGMRWVPSGYLLNSLEYKSVKVNKIFENGGRNRKV